MQCCQNCVENLEIFKMFGISNLLATGLWLLLSSPIYFIDDFIQDLPISKDPDSYLSPLQVITRYGYPAESHAVRTSDGYLLEIHRIPYGKAGKGDKARYPVLLYHGLLCSSALWLINGPEKSLGYRLADEGYDVWMANMRGNTFAKGHVTYNPAQKEFWDFSPHEISIYDAPAIIDFILNTTDHQQLFFIGHSLGNSIFFILTSVLPEYNDKIIAEASLAGTAVIAHTKSLPFLLLAPIANQLGEMYEKYQKGAFLEQDVLDKIMAKDFCSITILGVNFCELFLFTTVGWDPLQFNQSLIPVFFSQSPAGTSIRTILHVLQFIKPGLFANYDYGTEGNLQHYGTPKPPLYNFSNVRVPVKMYYGYKDLLVDPIDAKNAYRQLRNPKGLKGVIGYNHFDFFMGNNVNERVNDDVIKFVHSVTDSQTSALDTLPNAIRPQASENLVPPPATNISNDTQILNGSLGVIPNSKNFTNTQLTNKSNNVISEVNHPIYTPTSNKSLNGTSNESTSLESPLPQNSNISGSWNVSLDNHASSTNIISESIMSPKSIGEATQINSLPSGVQASNGNTISKSITLPENSDHISSTENGVTIHYRNTSGSILSETLSLPLASKESDSK